MSSAPLLGGRYEVHAEIGVGGMAAVHLGRQRGAAGFSRVVALKRMHPHLAKDPEVVAMFLDEARLASRIDHPNVVSITDVVDSGAEVFLVMAYVPGAPLNRVLARAPAAPPVALRVIRDALMGLSAAHQAVDEHGAPLRLVHRDVSPHNLLVGADGSTRVLDFGVAKAEGRLQQRTRTNETKGKVAYMAPEQVLCEAVDARTDVYAAGVCLWEMLAGRRAFEGPDPVIMRAIIEAPLAPLGAANGELGGVDDLILRATAKEKAARFPSAAEMVAAIDGANLPVASQEAVAAWLTEHLGSELAERAELVSRIEAGAMPAETALASPPAQGRSTPLTIEGATTSRTRPLVYVAIGALALLGVTTWMAMQSKDPAAASAAGARTAAPEGTSDTPHVPAPTIATVPSPVEPAASAAPPPPPSSSERARAVPLQPPEPRPTVAPSPSATAPKRRETLF